MGRTGIHIPRRRRILALPGSKATGIPKDDIRTAWLLLDIQPQQGWMADLTLEAIDLLVREASAVDDVAAGALAHVEPGACTVGGISLFYGPAPIHRSDVVFVEAIFLEVGECFSCSSIGDLPFGSRDVLCAGHCLSICVHL